MRPESISWLLEDSNPSVKMFTLTDVLGRSPTDPEVARARERVQSSRPVAALRRAQGKLGYWKPGDSSYNPKFTASVWPLMLLGELGAERAPWIESAVEHFFGQHFMANGAFCCGTLGSKDGIVEEPCLSGNILRTLMALGYREDPRVWKGIDWFPEMQFEDGGWNCDYPEQSPTHSSFMSTIEPLWAYSEIPRQRWTKKMKNSAERGAEFLLNHRVYKSHRDQSPVRLRDMDKFYPGNVVTQFHFPMYYYYDALHGLRVLTKLGYEDDERIRDALDLVKSKMPANGRWLLEGDWVRERKKDRTRKTLVTLERLHRPSKWVTLNCYRVLSKTGDLKVPN